MSHFLILVLILAGVAFYLMTAEERTRAARTALAVLRELRRLTTLDDLQPNNFCDALAARTRWAFVTPAICTLNVAMFIAMCFDARGLPSQDSLIAWGANFWPRTVNGEYWRFATTMFLHSGVFHLLFSVIGLLQIGLILERLVGPVAFTAVYLSAGISASVISVFIAPTLVSVGASPSILGIYGLLFASSIWTIVGRSDMTIPLEVAKRLAPGATLFLVYTIATHGFQSASGLTAFTVGFAGGLLMTREIGVRKPSMRKVATTMAAGVAMSAACAVMVRQPVREPINVRLEIEHVAAIEAHTANVYARTVDGFRKGRVTVDALTDLIERTIIPELRTASARLKALHGVPADQQPLISATEQFLSQRDESWRLRAGALRASDMTRLREADRKEQACLHAFEALTTKTKDLKQESTILDE